MSTSRSPDQSTATDERALGVSPATSQASSQASSPELEHSEPANGTVWIESHQCYWAILDAPGIRAGPLPDALRPVLADEIPATLEGIHAVCKPTLAGLLVCGVPRARLSSLPFSVVQAFPRSVPRLSDVTIDTSHLNLLVGDCEAHSIRRVRRQTSTLTIFAAIVVLLVVAAGFHRRASQNTTHSESLKQTMTQAIIAASGGDGTSDTFQTALRSLRQEAVSIAARPIVPDAAKDLTMLLSAWPYETQCDVQSFAVGPSGASATVVVPNALATSFLSSLDAPPGWTLEEPRLQSIRRGEQLWSQFTLQWLRSNTTTSSSSHTP